MGTPWDHAAERYLEEWVPRFTPYHLDLIRECSFGQGQHILVTSSGPGAEVLAVARVVGETGIVRATDVSAEMVRICREQAERATFSWVSCAQAEASDTSEGPWDGIVCAFGLWQLEDRISVLSKWADALTPKGKVGVITWGPPDENDPFEILSRFLRELEPDVAQRQTRIEADRDSMVKMFENAGLSMVRHTMIRHTVSFPTAEAFVAALSEGCTWRRIVDELGAERMGKVAARFHDAVGGPTAPLTFEPAATLAIAALPGAEVELLARPSARAPLLPGS